MPQIIPALIAAAEAAVAAAAESAGISAAVATTIATVAVNAAIVGGLYGLSLLLQDTPKLAQQKVNVRQPVASRRRGYGRVKTGGVYGFLAVRSPVLYYEILLHQGHIDGIEDYWLGEYTVNLNSDGYVIWINESSTPGLYQLDDGVYIAQIETQLGRVGQDAYGTLLSAFPETYTDAMQCQGIATALMSFTDPGTSFSNRYPSGLPMFNASYRASRVWDPRDMSQSRTDVNTWTWSNNLALCILDYLWNQDGMRLPYALIAPGIDVFKAQADLCDVIMPLADGGSEPQYRLSGTYELTDPPKKVLPLMLDPGDARLGLRADGVIVLDVGQYMAPVDTITDDQIVSYVGFSKGRQQADIRNEFRASFTSRDFQYVEQEAQPLINEASVTVDGLKTQMLDLTWAPSHRQARVKMKVERYRQDPDAWCGQIITNAYGLKFLEPNDDGTKKRMMAFTISELGITALPFEVRRFRFDAKSGRCTFDVVYLPSAAYDWDPETDEGLAPAMPSAIAPDGVENPDTLTVTVSGADLDATVDTPYQSGLTMVLQYAPTDESAADSGKTWYPFDQSGWSGTAGPLPSGSYDVRVWFQNDAGHRGEILYARGFIVANPGPGALAYNDLDFSQMRNSQYILSPVSAFN